MVKRTIANVSKVIAILVLCFLIFLAVIGGYLVGSMLEIAKEAPTIDPDALLSNLKENSVIVDTNGNLVEQIDTAEFRKIVPYEQIPQDLINAFISAEDRRFPTHDGVDLIGIAATVRDFFRSGDLRGASTITMQLARNVYLNNNVNWTRKIQEIFLALQIDNQLSKDQIMEAYLNRIFFGQNAYGVEAASQIYFSKDVQDLTLAQSAALASIVPAPSSYSLYSTYRPSQVTDERVLDETQINGERYIAVYNPPAYERSKWVLEQMLKNGYITQEEYDEAIATDVAATIDAPEKRAENFSTYISDLVKAQSIQILMDTQKIDEAQAREMLMYGGLTITSTVDMALQKELQDQVGALGSTLTSPSGARNPLSLDLDYDRSGNILGRDNSLLYYKASNLLNDSGEVVLPDNQFDFDEAGNLIIYRGRLRGYRGYIDIMDYYTFDDRDVLHTHRMGTIPIDPEFLTVDNDGTMHIAKAYLDSNTVPLYTLQDDGTLVLNTDYYDRDEIGVMQPQIAMTILDTTTGEVRATIGGREQDDRHFLNRAALYPRQPGSSIKPIAEYTAALAMGNNEGVAQDDAPVQMIDGNPWPNNVDLKFRGMLSMQEALVRSSNPVAVRWLKEVGLDATKEYLSRYGIINRDFPGRDHFVEVSEDPQVNDENLSLAIGAMTNGLTTLDLAGAYQAIGNSGQRIPSSSIAKIVDNRGNVYYENKHEGVEVLTPAVNYQMIDLLHHVVRDGFVADTLANGDIDLAGKTGTTNNLMDFWFAATTPYYTSAVWVGADNALLSMDGNSAVAANVYAQIHQTLHDGKEAKTFPIPEGVYEAEVSAMSGQIPTEATRAAGGNSVLTIPVSDETAPTVPDPVYVMRLIDTRNNLLAAENTPSSLTAYRVFIERPSDYNPADFDGITPDDWDRNVPTKYSQLGFFVPPSDYELQPDGTYVQKLTLPDGRVQVNTYDETGTLIRTEITGEPTTSEESGISGLLNALFPSTREEDPED